jgi:glycosyltransferase involved in cell wall biosynthesis
MKIIQLTPGTGNFYCGNCIRDNALVNALRKLGHDAVIGPMYLPMLTDEPAATGQPVRFSGVNVYLQQKFSFFRKAPRWVDRIFGANWMLKLAAKRAGMTQASDLGDMTVSMLRGEEGRQSKEIDKLIEWLKIEKPDVIGLSNCLLVGMARKIKQEINCAVICTLHGEDAFMDSLPESDSKRAWEVLAERANDIDAFIAVSQYFGDVMKKRMHIPDEKLHVLHNGISLKGYGAPPDADAASESGTESHAKKDPPIIGYLARMCHGKGLETLVDAYIALRKRDTVKKVKLNITGTKTPVDEPFIDGLRKKLSAAGFIDDVSFHPNVSRDEKISILKSLSVFSVPATYGEAFGLFVIEAMAAGVPVVQPRHAAFPEIIEATGGGILCEPDDPESLADGLEQLLLNSDQAQKLGQQGRQAIFDRFDDQHMAKSVLAVYEKACTQLEERNSASTS